MRDFEFLHLAQDMCKSNGELRKKMDLINKVATVLTVSVLCFCLVNFGVSVSKLVDAREKYQLHQTSGYKGWVTRRENTCLKYGAICILAGGLLIYKRKTK
jgi:hypothetical protein